MHTTHAAGNGHLTADWDSMPEWITTEEAMQISGYARNYLRRIIRQGKIAAEKKGTMWWIHKDSLQAYAAEMEALGNQRFDPRGHDHGVNSE